VENNNTYQGKVFAEQFFVLNIRRLVQFTMLDGKLDADIRPTYNFSSLTCDACDVVRRLYMPVWIRAV